MCMFAFFFIVPEASDSLITSLEWIRWRFERERGKYREKERRWRADGVVDANLTRTTDADAGTYACGGELGLHDRLDCVLCICVCVSVCVCVCWGRNGRDGLAELVD